MVRGKKIGDNEQILWKKSTENLLRFGTTCHLNLLNYQNSVNPAKLGSEVWRHESCQDKEVLI